jgi:hypothetical protein
LNFSSHILRDFFIHFIHSIYYIIYIYRDDRERRRLLTLPPRERAEALPPMEAISLTCERDMVSKPR